MNFPKENIIDNWLATNNNPEIDKFVEQNLLITAKVQRILKERNISQAEFARMLNRKPSEVSKWLSASII